jgi:hypothetical protein
MNASDEMPDVESPRFASWVEVQLERLGERVEDEELERLGWDALTRLILLRERVEAIIELRGEKGRESLRRRFQPEFERRLEQLHGLLAEARALEAQHGSNR